MTTDIAIGHAVFPKDFYIKRRNKILFLNKDKNVFAALVKNKHGYHFVNAFQIDKDGKIFYQFAMSSGSEAIFGLLKLSYSEKVEKIKEYGQQFLG